MKRPATRRAVDSRARVMAAEAAARLDAHEEACERRWKELRNNGRWVLGIVIAIGTSVIGYLLKALLVAWKIVPPG